MICPTRGGGLAARRLGHRRGPWPRGSDPRGTAGPGTGAESDPGLRLLGRVGPGLDRRDLVHPATGNAIGPGGDIRERPWFARGGPDFPQFFERSDSSRVRSRSRSSRPRPLRSTSKGWASRVFRRLSCWGEERPAGSSVRPRTKGFWALTSSSTGCWASGSSPAVPIRPLPGRGPRRPRKRHCSERGHRRNCPRHRVRNKGDD